MGNPGKPVDAVFAEDRLRAEWRSAWQKHMVDIGVPEAIQKALPADRYSGRAENGPTVPS